jgi:hypothetical protein
VSLEVATADSASSVQDTGGLPDTRGNKMMWKMCTSHPLRGSRG